MRNCLLVCFSLLAASLPVLADSTAVDKVYHPYVLPFEREFEWRLMSRQNDDGNQLAQRLAYGQSLTEYFTLEAYLVGERDHKDDFGLVAYELEGRLMLTDQGQYWADWGMLFELEKQHKKDAWEAAIGLLTEKELGRSSITANLFMSYEFGQLGEKELEFDFRMKYRYRLYPALQPGIELYTSEYFTGIGPSFMGLTRFDRQKQLKWELAFISGLNGDSKDHTLRFALEYEF